jgi:arylformamidase
VKLDDPDWLEQMYNNRARVPEHVEHFANWARESRRVRQSEPCTLDLPYGSRPRERLDVFPARTDRTGAGKGTGAPVLVFIHGGYWRSLDKSDHSFIASAFARKGVCVVVPNYELCPDITLPGIVMEMVRALVWTHRHIAEHGGDPRRITLAGHSAGGQLAAMLLTCDWRAVDRSLPPDLVTRALSISGLYDLEPLRHTPSLQSVLQLTPEQVAQASPARLPAPPGATLFSFAGGRESMEFIRQNELIRQSWGSACVPVCEALPGLNHFSILEALAESGHRLNRAALELVMR